MPHIINLASVLSIEEKFIKELHALFYNFFWSNRKHGISKTILIQDIDYGGIQMVCIPTLIKSIQVMWFKRLLNEIINETMFYILNTNC